MVYHTFRHAAYHHKRAGNRRRAISRRRKRKWRRKSTAKKALITAKRAYRLARILKKPAKWIKWSDAFELHSTNSTYGVAGSTVGDGRYHFRKIDGIGSALTQGYHQRDTNDNYVSNMYTWDWKQHPFPVCSRIVTNDAGGSVSFREIKPRHDTTTDSYFMGIGSKGWMRMFNNANSMTDGSCLFDYLLDAGPNTAAQAEGSYAERKLPTVVGITSPVNLMPRGHQGQHSAFMQIPNYSTPHKSVITVRMNFRIRDSHAGTLCAVTDKLRRDFSPNVVHCHIYLVEIPLGTLNSTDTDIISSNPILFQGLHGDTEAAVDNQYYADPGNTNSNAAAFLKNMFETDVLQMQTETNRMFWPKLRKSTARLERENGFSIPLPAGHAGTAGDPGSRNANPLDDQKYSTFDQFDDADTWALYGRRYPFKVLEHRSFRLGAKSSAQDLAIYETNMTFRIKKTMRYQDPLAGVANTGVPHMVDKEYRFVIIHNAANAIYPGVHTDGTARSVEVESTGVVKDGSWTGNPAPAPAEDTSNTLFMAACVEHAFQEK